MDLKNLLKYHQSTNARRHPHVVSILVRFNNSGLPFPDNIDVYALKINNVNALENKITQIWNNPKLNNLTDLEKIDKIHINQEKFYDHYNQDYEKALLNYTNGFGISLYKASSQDLKNWNILTLNTNTDNVVSLPCN